MKPKTKLQKQVIELSKQLPRMTYAQRKWGIEKCLKQIGYFRKQSIWCLECGHTWKPEENHLNLSLFRTSCPKCGAQLEIRDCRKLVFRDAKYYSIHTVKNEFQVLRHYLIEKECRPNNPAYITVRECVQNWISQDGKVTNVALNTYMSYYYDAWNFASGMEVRSDPKVTQKYDIHNEVYPLRKYTNIIKRNGFKGYFYNVMPVKLFTSLMTNSCVETLIKANQPALVKWAVYNTDRITEYWQSIKICIRNNYTVKDAEIWIDYVKLLMHFGRDIQNAKYVCPVNLKKEHDRYVEKRAIQKEKEDIARKKAKAIEDAMNFIKMKSKYFGISFTDGLIDVKVLESIQEHIDEGEALKHCVFVNDYHIKPNSLILSARIEGKPIETIEISLKDFSIIQCRGKHNENTEYHERIMNLVNENVHLIRERKVKKRIKTQLKTAV